MEGVVARANERKNVGPHASLCVHALGNTPLFYNGTDAYTMRQENDHFIYYNATIAAISNECPATTAPENTS